MTTIAKNQMKAWLLLDLAVSFMFCIFAPLEAYFSNESEYWFELSHLLPVVFVAFAAVFCLFALCSVALIGTRLDVVAFAFCLSALVFFYIQGNYIPRPYGVLDGGAIDWHGERFRKIANASIVVGIVCLSLCISLLCLKWLRERIRLIGMGICGFLIAVQLVSLVSLYVRTEILTGNSHSRCAVSSEKIFELSGSNNILMLLLDTFDAKYLNGLLDKDQGDDTHEVLENFTYYPDTLGLYPTTRAALAHLLTGVIYTNEVPYREYVEKAFRDNPLFTLLSEKGFSNCAYSDPTYFSADNPVFENVHRLRFAIQDAPHFAKTLFKLVLFNYMPHQFKRRFLVFGSDFLRFRKFRNSSGIRPYSLEVPAFYHELQKAGMSACATNSAFRFYHVEGVHPPYTFGRDLVEGAGRKYTRLDSELGCIALLKSFFEKLKDCGAYDVSTLIILADHGDTLYRQNPIFLIKNRNERHPFRISDVPFSYCDLEGVLLSLVRDGKEISEEHLSKLASRKNNRTYLFYRWGGEWDRRYLPMMEEMSLTGSAALTSGSQLSATGVRHGGHAPQHISRYRLGRPLTFTHAREMEFRPYIISGVHVAEESFTWTHDHEVVMRMKLDGEFNDLHLEIDCSTFHGTQRVFASANEHPIGSVDTIGRKKIDFHIPGAYIADDRVLTLRFELPDAISPEEVVHNGDVRLLALQLFSMKITSADGHQVSSSDDLLRCEKGVRLSFAKTDGAPALKHCRRGLSHSEKAFTWTLGNSVLMEFHPNGWKPKRFSLRYKTYLPKERVIIKVGESIIANYVAQGAETKQFMLPTDCVAPDKPLIISMELPDAISPYERNGAKDKRRLALRLFEMTLD